MFVVGCPEHNKPRFWRGKGAATMDFLVAAGNHTLYEARGASVS
jgi:hypothetical protein